VGGGEGKRQNERKGGEKTKRKKAKSGVLFLVSPLHYPPPPLLPPVVSDFHDSLKNVTAGFASFDLTQSGYTKADLVKVDVTLNGDVVNVLSFVSHRDIAQSRGRQVCTALQSTIPRAQFPIAIQAKINGKVVARTTVKPYRKDVLTKGSKAVGGGDITRKKKLLEKQKAGKKRMKVGGSNSTSVRLSQSALQAVITR